MSKRTQKRGNHPATVKRDHSTNEKFNCLIKMIRVSDNKNVEFEFEWGYPGYVRDQYWETDPVYIWEDGNYSCNCNRHDFFHRDGLKESYWEDVECGDGMYRVIVKNLETGKIIYEEPLVIEGQLALKKLPIPQKESSDERT